ncbi:MAG: type II toxin-antitoxin system Phd/YefM family antitoxin [Planctomycetota bacterium]
MKFVTIREFRNNVARIREELQSEREIILTANGRPFAMLTPVDPDTVEEEVVALRRARARLLFDRIGARAKAAGMDNLSMREIDAIIAKARAERRAGE